MQVKTSQISAIYRKLLYTNNIAPITIKFSKSNSLYDSCLNNSNDRYINFIPYSLSDSCLDAQVLFINDPIELINNEQYFNTTILNKIVFFHDDRILKMKKEDLFLFRQQLSKYTKFTFDHRVCSVINDAYPLNYGFKSPSNISQSRNKSIVFLGNEQNIDMVVHNQIKQIYSDIDFINIDKVSNTDISNTLTNYKVCISMNSIYNNLLAAANGCFIISSLEDNHEIPFYQKVSSFEEVLDKLSLTLKNYKIEDHAKISSSIVQKYDYSVFVNTISNIVKNTCNRAIIL